MKNFIKQLKDECQVLFTDTFVNMLITSNNEEKLIKKEIIKYCQTNKLKYSIDVYFDNYEVIFNHR